MADEKPQFACLPWYPRDFESATATWTIIERGVYRELLDKQWDIGSLPNDPRKLRALIRVTAQEWNRAWPIVSQKFEVGEDGQLRNARLEAHRQKAVNFYNRRKAGADKTNAKLGRGRTAHGREMDVS